MRISSQPFARTIHTNGPAVLVLDPVPVDRSWPSTYGLRIKIGSPWIGDTEAHTFDFTQLFARSSGHHLVDRFLSHCCCSIVVRHEKNAAPIGAAFEGTFGIV